MHSSSIIMDHPNCFHKSFFVMCWKVYWKLQILFRFSCHPEQLSWLITVLLLSMLPFQLLFFCLRAYSKALNADAMKIMHFLFLTNEGAMAVITPLLLTTNNPTKELCGWNMSHSWTLLLPTDAHNVKKHRVIKTF